MKVSSNYQKRTFTISVNGSKYKTNQLTKFEFEELEFNTDADWMNFLNKSNNYYRVK
jgi:hypothetical protein